jgi:hypothetical protein
MDHPPPPPQSQPQPESQQENNSSLGRRLLSASSADSLLIFAVDALALELLYALAIEITTESFQARVNQAAQELNLAPAIVDPASVEIINAPPITQPPPPPPSTDTTQTPAPAPPPPSLSSATHTSTNATWPPPALMALATLFALAYILPVGADDY